MRLPARGSIVSGGGRDLQGKFCLYRLFVLFLLRDDFRTTNKSSSLWGMEETC